MQQQTFSERIEDLFKSKLRVSAFDLLAVTQGESELHSWEFSKALWRVICQWRESEQEFHDACALAHVIYRWVPYDLVFPLTCNAAVCAVRSLPPLQLPSTSAPHRARLARLWTIVRNRLCIQHAGAATARKSWSEPLADIGAAAKPLSSSICAQQPNGPPAWCLSRMLQLPPSSLGPLVMEELRWLVDGLIERCNWRQPVRHGSGNDGCCTITTSSWRGGLQLQWLLLSAAHRLLILDKQQPAFVVECQKQETLSQDHGKFATSKYIFTTARVSCSFH